MKPKAKAAVSPPWSITAFTATSLYWDMWYSRCHNRDRCHNSSRRLWLNCNLLVNFRFWNLIFRSLISEVKNERNVFLYYRSLFILLQKISASIFTKWFGFTSLTVLICNGNSWSLRLIVGQINWFVMFSHGNIQINLQTLIREKRTFWSMEKIIKYINRLEIKNFFQPPVTRTSSKESLESHLSWISVFISSQAERNCLLKPRCTRTFKKFLFIQSFN